jgi:hypothetical protein
LQCRGRRFLRVSGRQGPDRCRLASPIQHTPPVFVYFRRLLDVFTERLHGYERRLAKGGELKRVKECAGLSQRVAEEAEAFVRRFFEVVAGFPPEVVAVAVLWTAAKTISAPRSLEDLQ